MENETKKEVRRQIVKCNNVNLNYELTFNKEYEVLEILENGLYVIINDKGQKHHYSPKRFY